MIHDRGRALLSDFFPENWPAPFSVFDMCKAARPSQQQLNFCSFCHFLFLLSVFHYFALFLLWAERTTCIVDFCSCVGNSNLRPWIQKFIYYTRLCEQLRWFERTKWPWLVELWLCRAGHTWQHLLTGITFHQWTNAAGSSPQLETLSVATEGDSHLPEVLRATTVLSFATWPVKTPGCIFVERISVWAENTE